MRASTQPNTFSWTPFGSRLRVFDSQEWSGTRSVVRRRRNSLSDSESAQRHSHFAPVLATLLLLPGVLIAVLPVWERSSVLFEALRDGSVEDYRRRLNDDYAWISADVAFLDAAPSGPIYAVGNPLYYLLSGRTQAGAIHGWAWGIMPEAIWHAFPREIAAARPIFMYFDAADEALMRKRQPEIMDQVFADYRVHHRHERGTWYVRRDPDPGSCRDDRPRC